MSTWAIGNAWEDVTILVRSTVMVNMAYQYLNNTL